MSERSPGTAKKSADAPDEFDPWMHAAFEKIAEDAAKRALASVGLGDPQAAEDLRDLRATASMLRSVKSNIGKRILDSLVTAFIVGLTAVLSVGWWGGRAP